MILSSLRLLGSVGEPINPEAWKWYHKVIGKDKCPIMDTWWQTETGGFMITPLPITPLKAGSATKPFFGNEISVVDEAGNEVLEEEGKLVIKNPWPGMARTVLGDPERYVIHIGWIMLIKNGTKLVILPKKIKMDIFGLLDVLMM
jgi:acetyl-CoA synthetase